MPRRKRRDLRAARAEEAKTAAPPVDSDVATFARRVHEAEAARKQARNDARTAKQRAEEGVRLQQAKDAATESLKATRRKERIRPGEVESAEAAYRAALAALMTFETGTAPSWAATPDATDEDDEEPTIGV